MKTKRRYNTINKTRRFGGDLEKIAANNSIKNYTNDFIEKASKKASEKASEKITNIKTTAPAKNNVEPANNNNAAPATPYVVTSTDDVTSTDVDANNNVEPDIKESEQKQKIAIVSPSNTTLPTNTSVSHIYFFKNQKHPFIVDGLVSKGDVDKFLKKYGISSIPAEFLPDSDDNGFFGLIQKLYNNLKPIQEVEDEYIKEFEYYLDPEDGPKITPDSEHVMFVNLDPKLVEFLKFIQDFKEFLSDHPFTQGDEENKEAKVEENKGGGEPITKIPTDIKEKTELKEQIQEKMQIYLPESKETTTASKEKTKMSDDLSKLYDQYKDTDAVLQLAGKHFGILSNAVTGTFDEVKIVQVQPEKQSTSIDTNKWFEKFSMPNIKNLTTPDEILASPDTYASISDSIAEYNKSLYELMAVP